eukprot:CAMPEP_0204300166 /NCGR_PEP_ID=MMETSP0468-20130131/78096_1 /ASSEMBLY_ACC=CAM_ASM_000383 /TAXON_ID=2969 /ORGANISM="Oxyrrhis marina" /LENGTH=53 /DNA_ID=CAMNT_0051279211 /DNA_START=196 /DNA_END=353 /DNA_ORIENTATION=+
MGFTAWPGVVSAWVSGALLAEESKRGHSGGVREGGGGEVHVGIGSHSTLVGSD